MNGAMPSQNQPQLDRLQLAAVCLLMLVGGLFVYSATSVNELSRVGSWYKYLWAKQIIWYVLGIGLGVVLLLVDYRSISRWSLVIYWATILTLVAVLIPGIGSTHGWGARR